jgi:hypothetical protein
VDTLRELALSARNRGLISEDQYVAIAGERERIRGHSMMHPQTITQPSRTGGGTDVILVSPKGDVIRTIARGISYKRAIEIVRRGH